MFAVAASTASAAIVERRVEYRHGDVVLEGVLAYDDAIKGPRPAVMVVHDWNGIDAYEVRRTRMLAELGYVAFAADIYGKGVRPKNPQESAAEAGKYRGANIPLFRQRLLAGLEAMRAQPNVSKEQVAAIGYCFGGTGVIELARTGADVRGVVSFHGSLAPSPDTPKIRAKVNIQHGAIDPMVPWTAVQATLTEMDAAKVDYVFTAYAGAVHSFTEPNAGNDISRGAAYNADADRRSWEALKKFLAELFPARS